MAQNAGACKINSDNYAGYAEYQPFDDSWRRFSPCLKLTEHRNKNTNLKPILISNIVKR